MRRGTSWDVRRLSCSLYLLQCLTYLFADALELMFVGIGLIFVPLTMLTYKYINAKRDALQLEASEKGVQLSAEELRRMGDRAPDFRYTL